MKKIYCLLTMLLCIAYARSSHAQNSGYIAGVWISDSSCLVGAATNPNVILTGEMGIFTADSINDFSAKVFWGDGTDDDITLSPTYFFGINQTHSYAAPGNYSIVVVVYYSGNAVDSSEVLLYSSYCRAISGQTYLRNDADCVQGTSENTVYFQSNIELRKNGVPVDTIFNYGAFFYMIPNPDFTAVYELVPLDFTTSGFMVSCPAANYAFTLDTLDYPENVFNYALECDASFTGFDLYTNLWGMLRVNTGPSYLYLPVGNAACTPTAGQLTLQISPKYTFSSANIPPTSVSGNTVVWDFAALSSSTPYASTVSVTLNPVGTLTVGDTAIFHTTITPLTGDVDTSNNYIIYTDSIRAAFDPNEKHVAPSGDIYAGQLLSYTINFENLGNDTAFNIHILDALSSFLDPATLRITGSSHLVYPIIYEDGGVQYVKFDFPDIKLADASYPESNKGFVTFTIRALTDLQPGDVIENSAGIYFDFNPAVVTNTVYSKIPNPTRVDDIIVENGLKVHPNPAADMLFIDVPANGYQRLIITNAIGQQVFYKQVQKGMNRVDIKSLPAGMYNVTLIGDAAATKSAKIIIQEK